VLRGEKTTYRLRVSRVVPSGIGIHVPAIAYVPVDVLKIAGGIDTFMGSVMWTPYVSKRL
jgi:hypothetical protein